MSENDCLQEGTPACRGGARILAEVSPGELLDKITILRIKQARISEPARLAHVRAELASLEDACDRSIPPSADLAELVRELEAVNLTLWNVEDELRRCEQRGDFGAAFIELARSVYRTNDRRAQLKRHINALLGSDIREEKLHPAY